MDDITSCNYLKKLMYKEKTDRELIELSTMHEKLTFQAQLDLLEELNHRNIVEKAKDLEYTIEKTMSEIKNLKYLKDIGFTIKKLGDSLIITRTLKAIIVDVIASVFGILFCIVGLFGILGLIGSFFNETEFNLSSLVGELARIGVGILGVRFLKGIKRLIDYFGFELQNTNGIIILKKRFDLKLVEIQKNVSFLNLEKQADRLSLRLEKDEIFNGNAKNLIQNMTLNELIRKLKTVAST